MRIYKGEYTGKVIMDKNKGLKSFQKVNKGKCYEDYKYVNKTRIMK